MPTTVLSDERLIANIREKDRELYGEIIRRYQTKLGHYLKKFIRSHDELEDVLQEVFIKAYRNLFDFNIDKKFSPWIYRIAHNEALNYLKKHKRQVLSLDDSELEVIDEKVNIQDAVDAHIAKATIEKCFARLKDKYREPLILYFFEQKTYDEISDILHVPAATVGVLIMRGKKVLKESLKQELYGKQPK